MRMPLLTKENSGASSDQVSASVMFAWKSNCFRSAVHSSCAPPVQLSPPTFGTGHSAVWNVCRSSSVFHAGICRLLQLAPPPSDGRLLQLSVVFISTCTFPIVYDALGTTRADAVGPAQFGATVDVAVVVGVVVAVVVHEPGAVQSGATTVVVVVVVVPVVVDEQLPSSVTVPVAVKTTPQQLVGKSACVRTAMQARSSSSEHPRPLPSGTTNAVTTCGNPMI
jgi:hypothetical protein